MALSDFSGSVPGPSGAPCRVAGTRGARPPEISHVLVIFRVLPCPGLRPRQRFPGPCHHGPVLVAFHPGRRCRPLHNGITRLHPFTLRLRPGSRSVYTSPAASRRRAQHSIPSGWLALKRVGIAPTGKCQLFVAYLPAYLATVSRGRSLGTGAINHPCATYHAHPCGLRWLRRRSTWYQA